MSAGVLGLVTGHAAAPTGHSARQKGGDMGLDVAIDELYATGWSALDTLGCMHHSDGRCYPEQTRLEREFRAIGMELSVRRIELFDCYRAEWTGEDGAILGAVVGQTACEAGVYALAQARRMAPALTA